MRDEAPTSDSSSLDSPVTAMDIPSGRSGADESAYGLQIASPKSKRLVDLGRVFGDGSPTPAELPLVRPARAVLFEATPKLDLEPLDADQRPLSEGRNDSGVDLSQPTSPAEMAEVVGAASKLPAPAREHLAPLVFKKISLQSADGGASEVLWLPTSPPQSPLPATTPPLRSALKSPSPSRASSRSASPSPKMVHFSPTHQIRHFFLSDPPVDCAEPSSVRYSLRSMIPVQFNNPPIRLDSVRLPDDHAPRLEGKILVRNLAFDKRVFVRYTSDRWDTYDEAAATYVSGDGNVDVFRFDIDLTGSIHNDKITTEYQMAVQGVIGTSTYWDNNAGRNYDMAVTRHLVQEERKTDPPLLELGPAVHAEGEADLECADSEDSKSNAAAFHNAETRIPTRSALNEEEDLDSDADEDGGRSFQMAFRQRGRQGSILPPRTKRVVLTQPPPVLPPTNPFFAPTAPAERVSASNENPPMTLVVSPPIDAAMLVPRTASPITPPSAGGPPTATLASINLGGSSSAFFGGMPAEHYARMFGTPPTPLSELDHGPGRSSPQNRPQFSTMSSVVY